MRNLSKITLLKLLKIPADKPWVINKFWSQGLNKKLLEWIGLEFIPKQDSYIFIICRGQTTMIWYIFLEWMKVYRVTFDLSNPDLEILEKFCNYLPIISWSKSSIQLIEYILIETWKFLSSQLLMLQPAILRKSLFLTKNIFSIPIYDYQRVRTNFAKSCDYAEIICLDLYSCGIKDFALKGKDIVFNNGIAYIISDNQIIFTCPEAISKSLLKLLRIKNILADDNIFGSLNEELLKRKIFKICSYRNIPLFAAEFIYGIVQNFSGEGRKDTLDTSFQDLVENTVKRDNFKPCLIEKIIEESRKSHSEALRMGYAWCKKENMNQLNNQIEVLKNAGCQQIITETTEYLTDPRPKLKEIINTLLPGDKLVVYKITCMGLNISDTILKITEFMDLGIGFESIFEGFNTNEKNWGIEKFFT